MLERQGLVLCPWTAPTQLANAGWETVAACDRVRPILDSATRQSLGFASTITARGWAAPFFRRGLEVFETEDASLVFRIYQPWLLSWTWDVFEAEDRHIGIVYRGMLFDADAARFGVLTLSNAGDQGRFKGSGGADLAGFQLRDDELHLSFHPAVDNQPFARMVLLGATLALADRLTLGRKRLVVAPAGGVQPC